MKDCEKRAGDVTNVTSDVSTLTMAALYKIISNDNRDEVMNHAVKLMRRHGEAITGSNAYYSGRIGQIYVLMSSKHGHLASAFEELQFIKTNLTSANLQA